MKKSGKIKRIYIIVFSMLMILLLVAGVSAGVLDWLKGITGRATSAPVDLNISVGVPSIITVYNNSVNVTDGPNEALAGTNITINFTVYAPSGEGNLNHTTAKVNATLDATRESVTCAEYETTTNYVNYTCNITLWWWDGAGTWNITASVRDNNSNLAQNTTASFIVGTTTGFTMAPTNLTWDAIGAGATNQSSNNDPVVLNNTGNDVIDSPEIQINATNLRGETDNTIALWAGNFSISWDNGGSPPAECGGTTMSAGAYTGVTGANLSKGNFTIDDKNQGQEQLYFCLKLAGSELSTQPYSTVNESSWTIKII